MCTRRGHLCFRAPPLIWFMSLPFFSGIVRGSVGGACINNFTFSSVFGDVVPEILEFNFYFIKKNKNLPIWFMKKKNLKKKIHFSLSLSFLLMFTTAKLADVTFSIFC